jgi:16S rRNA (uracil1498-N3)-methyltransferase
VRRAFVPVELLARATAGAPFVLPADAAHRLARVLRLEEGARVELFDGEGRVVRGAFAGERLVDVTVHAEEDALPPFVVAQASAKGDKLEVVVQKGTELGAARFVVFTAERSIARMDKLDDARADKKLARLTRIAEDAARQCGRARVPVVDGPVAFAALVAEVRAFAGVAVVGAVSATEPLSRVLAGEPERIARGALVIVGPEGGLTDAEIEALVGAGARAVRLGAHVLRTETAGLVALAAFQAQVGTL